VQIYVHTRNLQIALSYTSIRAISHGAFIAKRK